jgi:rubrerythrin
MAFDFTAKEIFEMAKQIERNGIAFYQKAAKSVSDAGEKEMLLDLARMEEDHEATFEKMEAELKEQESAPTVFDPEDEGVQYLKSLADTRVFFEKEIDLSSIKSILKSAITAEKDSIVFYLGMKELVPEKLGKERIDSIIKEEMSHIRLLGRKLVTAR